jgi:hypothetical protein
MAHQGDKSDMFQPLEYLRVPNKKKNVIPIEKTTKPYKITKHKRLSSRPSFSVLNCYPPVSMQFKMWKKTPFVDAFSERVSPWVFHMKLHPSRQTPSIHHRRFPRSWSRSPALCRPNKCLGWRNRSEMFWQDAWHRWDNGAEKIVCNFQWNLLNTSTGFLQIFWKS